MKIALNIIGILIFFLTKFATRKDKDAPVSASFWLKDNWEQLIAVALFDVALMLLVFTGGLQLSFEKLTVIPAWLQVTGDGAVCFAVGAFIAWAAYTGYKKIVLDKR